MITVIANFQLPEPMTPDAARQVFLSTAPKYRDVPGLIRKYYVLAQDGRSAGGIYLWRSRAEAEAMYTPGWHDFVKQKYGTDASVTYMHCPVVVDNLSHEILGGD